MFKYRVHEVAKDFKIPTKKITEILTQYATTPKNHMHILSVQELDIIFEYLTTNNQIESIEEVFAVAAPAAPAAKPDGDAGADKASDKSTTGAAAPTTAGPEAAASTTDAGAKIVSAISLLALPCVLGTFASAAYSKLKFASNSPLPN